MRFFIILLISALHFQLYAQQDYFKNHALISSIYISGNQTTKDFIILREVPFKEKGIIDLDKINELLYQGRNNLVNLSLFNFVYITHKLVEGTDSFGLSEIEISIDLEERWYYWPKVDISLDDRNLSNWFKDPRWDKITYNVGFKIYNFLG